MTDYPDPLNDDLGGEDTDLMDEILGHAKAIAEDRNYDIQSWAVRVSRMRDLLQELLGKPIDHGDFRR